MKKIRFWALGLCLALLLSSLCILAAAAEEPLLEGDCGAKVRWTLNTDTGELVIKGTGAMTNYSPLVHPSWSSKSGVITSVTVEEGVTSLGSYAFLYCSNLVTVTLPDTLKTLPASLFSGCRSLTTIHIPAGLTSVGDSAFNGCQSLTEVVLPEGVTAIGNKAFNGCTSLNTLFLPSTLTSLGSNALAGTAPEKVLFNGSSTKWTAVSVGAGNDILQDALIMHPGHSFTQEAAEPRYVVSEATCHASAVYYRSCICGEAGSTTFTHGEPAGHRGGKATCSQLAVCDYCGESYGSLAAHTPNGKATCTEDQVCTVCGTVLKPAFGHLHQIIINPPTCTQPGFTNHVCGVCGDQYIDTPTEPLGHTKGPDATCTEDQVCTVCHEVLLPAYGHSYEDTVTPPTCVDGGFTTHVCAACEHTYTDAPVDALGHTESPAATCTEDQICTVCHEVLVEKLGHDYRDTVTPPTCVDEGFTAHTCSRCQDAYTDTPVDALGHTEGPAATCTEDQICTVCQEVLTERHGHSYVDEVTLAPTCTQSGVRTYTCTVCDHVSLETIDPLGHTEGPAATCTEDQLCTVCNTVLAERLGHSYTDTTVEPTCTEQGYVAHTCDTCLTVYHDSFTDPLGHTEGDAATCTEDQLCTVCGTLLAERLGHSYTDTVVEPTCYAQGYTVHSCDVCGDTHRDTLIPPKGHTEGPAATCTEDQLCTVCGAVLAEQTGHDYKATVVEPLCDTQGYTLHACEVCGDSYRDTLTPPKGHTEGPAATCTEDQTCTACGCILSLALGHVVTDTVVSPSCSQQGYTQHTCERCQYTYRDTVTPATGHTPGAAPTCTDAQTCATCGEVLASKLGHDYRSTVVAGSCTTPGYISHECALCHATYRDSYTAAAGHNPGVPATCTAPQLCTVCNHVIAPALGHDYEDTVTPPTCTNAGYTVHDCKACDHVYVGETTDALGHTAGPEATCAAPQLCTVCGTLLTERSEHVYEEVTVEPTCTEDGYIAHTCSLCEHTFVTDVTPATGHTAGDWVIVREPDVGVSGRKHKTCEHCDVILEAETFWPVQESTPTEPGTDVDRNTEAPEEEEGGCQLTGGNIVVIVIVLVAAFLLWFVDMRRR